MVYRLRKVVEKMEKMDRFEIYYEGRFRKVIYILDVKGKREGEKKDFLIFVYIFE